ncbi:MAG: molybdenum cofactor guanylyltransferase [Nitrospirae bacterium]|nr:molybdenum cofactor guanylyltransferase [Nitrospirota bacterium]
MSYELIDCTGVILAGGENKRMPVPKAFIKVNGERIIDKNLELMKKLFKEVFIVTNQPEAYFYLRATMLGDIYNIRGPMTGIFTSLVNSAYPWIFVTACDMPFINYKLIRYMSLKRNNYKAVVPVFRRNIEPLFAFYSKSLCHDMEKALISGETGIQDFLRNKKVRYIRQGEIKGIDPEGKSFINLNTPEDVKTHLSPEGINTCKILPGRRLQEIRR